MNHPITRTDALEYTTMVQNLAKPGEDIIATLRPHKAHLLHMAIGLVGEIGELSSAILSNDKENAKEEIGDALFYAVGFFDGLQASIFRAEVPRVLPLGLTLSGVVNGQVASTEFLDKVKKLVIYNKEISQEEMLTVAIPVLSYLEQAMDHFGLSMESCMEHNINKLSKGKNARYSSGKYSDDQAQARADKEGAE